jgi:peptidoglycan DL-endopeptidase CwlO
MSGPRLRSSFVTRKDASALGFESGTPRTALRGGERRTWFRACAALGTVVVAAGLLVSVPSAGQADPTSITDVQKKIEDLYHEAEIATEQYNGYQARMRAAERELKVTQERVGEQQDRLNQLLAENSVFATMAYRNGGVDQTLQLFLSDNPKRFLEQATTLDQLSAQQAEALRRLQMTRQDLLTIRAQASQQIGEIEQLQSAMDEKRDAIEASMRQANALLATLKQEQRAFLMSTGSVVVPDSILENLPGGRAGKAIKFAIAQIGEPYVWGTSGPSSWDCSGLTLRAYQAAGITLPRISGDQATVGTRVAEADLKPGDLVFFYSPISHVGIYIGEGLMIHAPHPGDVVKVTPIDTMPFATARRIG